MGASWYLLVVLAGSLSSVHAGIGQAFDNFCSACGVNDGYGQHICRMSSAALCSDDNSIPFCDVCTLSLGGRETKEEYLACITAAQAHYHKSGNSCQEVLENQQFDELCSVCRVNDGFGQSRCRKRSALLCDNDDSLSFCDVCSPRPPNVEETVEEFKACITAMRAYCEGENIIDTYRWRFGSSLPSSSDCSVTCGTGTYSVVVKCVNDMTEDEVADSNCDTTSKPSTIYECNRPPCNPKGKKFSVVATPWSDCSKSCSQEGVSQRQVECFDSDSGLVVGARECGSELYNQPLNQECNEDVGCTGGYFLRYTPWSGCSQGCVDNGVVGVSERTVKCFFSNPGEPGEGGGGVEEKDEEEKPMRECEDNGHAVGPLMMPCNTNKVCDVRSPNGGVGLYSSTMKDILEDGSGGGGGEEDATMSAGVVGGVGAGMVALVVALVAANARRRRIKERQKLMKVGDKKTILF